uniref:VWFA domain-containing protein n=1 Tax=Callorhinchus milii TaxID=7868 RepID=A0A4W3GBD9_CALMI
MLKTTTEVADILDKADIVFLIDGSSSIAKSDFQLMKKFLKDFTKMFNIGERKFQFALGQYSTKQKAESYLSRSIGQSTLHDSIDKMSQLEGGTNTGKALTFVKSFFEPTQGSRKNEGVPQYLLVITDGQSQDSVVAPANGLRQQQINVFAIGVGRAFDSELIQIAGGADRKFSIENYADLDNIKRRIVHNLCRTPTLGPSERFADVVFLVEGSQNIGKIGFQQIQLFLTQTISQLNIGADKYRIGLAQYNRDVHNEFFLNQFVTKGQVLNYVRKKFTYRGGAGLKTGHAIDYLRSNYFIPSAGSRKDEGVPQIAVVISATPSEDDVKTPFESLNKVGVKIISIGVGKSDLDQLFITRHFSYPPSIFKTIDFNIVYQPSQDVVSTIKNITKQGDSKEPPAVCQDAPIADIVFLVVGSTSIGETHFELVRNFLSNIIRNLNVGAQKVRIGLIHYNDGESQEITFRSNQNKNDILKQVKTFPFRKGNTAIGKAIHYMKDNYFTKSSVSRANQGIPQIAIVITDGTSDDDVTKPAIELRDKGVVVFALGIKNANQTELNNIASHPLRRFVSRVDKFELLDKIKEEFQKKLCYEIIKRISIIPQQSLLNVLKQCCAETEEADIFFLIDESSSIQPADFIYIKTFMNDIVKTFHIGPKKVRTSVAMYATAPRTAFTATEYTSVTKVESAIGQITQAGGDTYTGRALKYMKNLFSEAEKSRNSRVRRFLIIVTDGEAHDNVKYPAEELRKEGIVMYAVGVGNINITQLNEIGDAPERVFNITNFDILKDLKPQIVQDICSKEACSKLDKADIIFLIDESGSIKDEDFPKIKHFMISFVNKTNIGLDKVQIGVIKFASQPTLVFKLNEYSTQPDLIQGINTMDHLKGGTEIGRALTFTADYFDGSKGGRLSVPQYLIVVTDGYSSDSVVAPATALRDKGIITFAIGVAESPWEQLREIAGSDDQVHFIEEYDALEQVKTDILSKICDSHKDCGRAEIADIIFVIDGSFNINKEQFQFVKTFMVALVNSSDVGMSNVRFGAVLYDTNPHTIFHLNELKSKAEVQNEINAIGNLTKGQTYTSKALNHAKKLLAPEYNGRNSGKVPQILILITHEKAADNAVLETTAQSIRDHGVSIYAIGVAGADLKELNLIAGSDKYFYVPRYDNLRYLTPNISQLICDASNLDCEVEKADIVFLIDGSGSVQTDDFQLIKEFLKNVITMFDTGEGKVQFALGQYSVDLHPEIYLKDQSKLYDGIDKMNQLGGGTNTGRALTSVNDFFEPTEGCRKNEGVPQYLLVITDGQSQDSVVAPANGLRRQQVNVFAIGVGEAVDSELIQIAGDANRKYSIKNFADLNNIKRRVTRSICACSSKDCSMNIAVGFDLTHPIGEEIFTGQHGLQAKLENILQRIGSVDKINCASNPSLKIRVGFHIQSDTGEAIFETELKEYNRKDVDDLKGIRTTSRIDLNEGYLASFSNKFIESAGKIQVVLMFTDGLDDNLERLEKTSRILRKGGVHALITVALENAVDVDNISLIEFGRGFEYKNQLSIGMQDIESSLLNQINVIAGRECCNLFCTCTGEPGRRGDHGSPGPKVRYSFKGLPGNEGPGGESVSLVTLKKIDGLVEVYEVMVSLGD